MKCKKSNNWYEKFYDFYEKHYKFFLFIPSIILSVILIIFSVLNTFAIDYTDDYKAMSQAFEEKREYICGLLNPDTKIDMYIGENNEYKVYSEQEYSINVTLADSKYILAKSPSIKYPISINEGSYNISEKYHEVGKDSTDYFCYVILIIAFIIGPFVLILLIDIAIEEILIKICNYKEKKENKY